MKESGPDIIEDVTMLKPGEPFPWLWVNLALIALVVLVVLYLYFRKKYKARAPLQPAPPPADRVALEKLAAIRHLIAEGQHEQFVVAVSLILRAYVQDRFALNAPHLSTEEFLYQAERSPELEAQWREKLGAFLAQCDRVKFALAHLQPPRMQTLYDTAEKFLKVSASSSAAATRPAAVPAA